MVKDRKINCVATVKIDEAAKAVVELSEYVQRRMAEILTMVKVRVDMKEEYVDESKED